MTATEALPPAQSAPRGMPHASAGAALPGTADGSTRPVAHAMPAAFAAVRSAPEQVLGRAVFGRTP
ncbi:hypothetical protein ACFS5L_11380 [Streptomyces phyllanthi]|uniref:Uncharacterized protein n=1 Tax=Streptomyces phyllanthi TaxID=1803180 RepID=A0A5N8WAG2_9ACTN|nr:hypothetical protein [Streptomyces phyllanthi]MPY43115.1 hypothetical protein [Streptomyces phyllanthi]